MKNKKYLFFISLVFLCAFSIRFVQARDITSFNEGWSFKKGPFSIEEFAINIITYSCALIVPAAVNIFVTIKNYKNIVSLVIITLVLVASVIFCVAYSVFNDALWTSIICCVLSLILWVIANSDNEQLRDDSFRQDIKDKSEKLASNW